MTTAYLNGELDEVIFMEVPHCMKNVLSYIINKGYREDQLVTKARTMLDKLASGSKVCCIKKALYDLKQASRFWYKRLDKELRVLGLKPTKGDSCVYIRNIKKKLVIIVIYVDNILAMCTDLKEIARFGDELKGLFEVKDIGWLRRCLGMDFVGNDQGMFVNQKTYITNVLQRFGMQDCNPVSTPLDPGTKLVRGEAWSDSDDEKPPYQELVGCLLYLW